MREIYLSRSLKLVVYAVAVSIIIPVNSLLAAGPQIETAKGEQLATAIGHYARSRSLLLEAIREFDRASDIAAPDSLLDRKAFRETLIGRAEDLRVILAPQARVTEGGVKFEADTRLLRSTSETEN